MQVPDAKGSDQPEKTDGILLNRFVGCFNMNIVFIGWSLIVFLFECWMLLLVENLATEEANSVLQSVCLEDFRIKKLIDKPLGDQPEIESRILLDD